MQHRVKDAFRFASELCNFAAQVLLDLDLPFIRLFDKMIEVSLQLLHNMLNTVAVGHAEAVLNLARRNQISLEHFKVFAEPGHLLLESIKLSRTHLAFNSILLFNKLLNGIVFASQSCLLHILLISFDFRELLLQL